MNGFVKNESHHHREHLEDIARRLQHLSGFKSPDKPMSDAAAGGAVLATVRKVLGSEFRSLDDRLTSFGFESPRFAMDEFIEEHAGDDPQRADRHRHRAPHLQPQRLGCLPGKREPRPVRQQVSRGNESAVPFKGEATAQLMDMSMAETAEQPKQQSSHRLICRAIRCAGRLKP